METMAPLAEMAIKAVPITIKATMANFTTWTKTKRGR